jgi:hypothetical protein
VGAWLNSVDIDSLAGLRIESGFFSADAIGYIAPLLDRLKECSGRVVVVVGSNQKATTARAVDDLRRAAGEDRDGLDIAVVQFANAFFHPKVIHLEFAGQRASCYVGSANLTSAGLSALHVEAGLLLDTNEGDPASVLAEISGSIEAWFDGQRPGVTRVSRETDLSQLVESGLLASEREQSQRTARAIFHSNATTARLRPLVSPRAGSGATPSRTVTFEVPEGAATVQIDMSPVEIEWSKALTTSDAQRKPTGNQRGSITLVRGNYDIDAATWFREVLFASLLWNTDTTSTGKLRETATALMHTVILGNDLGDLEIPLSHAPNRESHQKNYVSLLHLGPLSSHFTQHDYSGRTLTLRRDATGGFALTIT